MSGSLEIVVIAKFSVLDCGVAKGKDKQGLATTCKQKMRCVVRDTVPYYDHCEILNER